MSKDDYTVMTCYIKYADMIRMCEDNPIVKAYHCVRVPGLVPFMCNPGFIEDLSYEFAQCIIDDTPIFIGDRVYIKGSTESFIVAYKDAIGRMCDGVPTNWTFAIRPQSLTIIPPKKTFSLNSVELPAPDKEEGGFFIELEGIRFKWENKIDRDNVKASLLKVLRNDNL